MSSTILYKFRSGTTFEALSLPGNNARLLDIKKAIVTAKRLDQGSMDFDLSVKDATSGVEYLDDTAILPRGTRIVVQRLPSARGQGILAKIARSQFGDRAGPGNPNAAATSTTGPNADFYTIDSRDHDEDEEFVSTSTIPPPPPPSTDDSELAALRAATDATISGGPGRGMGRGAGGVMLRGRPASSVGGFRPNQPAGLGPPPSRGLDSFLHSKPNNRPDADPEIREQEHQPQKKRATGIPRTFLSLSAPQGTDGPDGAGLIIQPNTFVFEELVTRGGGQSENTSGTKRDLDYALKITATPIPEYLQCAICHNVVRDAMMLPWDPEGRTTCEQCIRTALTENGFRCPLTQQEGVSPDDLLPNHALRKAAVQFVKDVMEKMKEIDQHAEVEEDINIENDKQNLLEGDLNDKGVVLSRRAAAAEKRKQDVDDFAGDDDFGGDVFAVEVEKPIDDNLDDPMMAEEDAPNANAINEIKTENEPLTEIVQEQSGKEILEQTKPEDMDVVAEANVQNSEKVDSTITSSNAIDTQNRHVATRRRGPPMGYTMGPAIAVVQTPPADPDIDHVQPFERGSYRGRRGGGRAPYNGGRGFRGRYDSHTAGSRYVPHDDNSSRGDTQSDNIGSENRAAKRVRSQSESGNDDVSTSNEGRDQPQDNWNDGEGGGRGMIPRGDFHSHGRGGRWNSPGNRGIGNESRPGRWGVNTESSNDNVAAQDEGGSQQDNWNNSDMQRGRGEFRPYGRGGRWGGRGGRDNGNEGRQGRWEASSDGRSNRGGYRGGSRGGRAEFRGGSYRGGDHEAYRGGRGGYRGGGRGRY